MLWTISGSVNFGGKSAAYTRTVETESGIDHEYVLAAGKAGTLTTRTNNTQGVVTLGAGHGLASGTFDVHFADGSRHGVTAVIVENAATISLGTGDNLPDDESAVVFSPRTEIDTDVDGDLVEIVSVTGTARVGVEFAKNDETNLLNVDVAAGGAYEWDSDSLSECPLAGMDVGKAWASAGTAVATTVRVGIGYNS